jgi:hypothetical protein
MKLFGYSSDPTSLAVIVCTLVLFILSLVEKGFTHEVLLEAAVFLVSIKLIIMAKKSAETETRLETHLSEISAGLNRNALLIAAKEGNIEPLATESGKS